MKTEQIIKTIQEYNDWRRARGKWDVDTFNEGESFFDSVTAHEVGLTIDSAIEQLQELEKERDQAIEIARIAIEAIQTICGHAQFCDQCASFEIAKQCDDELNGFDRLNLLKDKCATENNSK